MLLFRKHDFKLLLVLALDGMRKQDSLDSSISDRGLSFLRYSQFLEEIFWNSRKF